MYVRKATFADWDQAPIVFSTLPCGFLTEPDRPLTADSQISSSILIQEARRRHQPPLDFPWRSSKAEISCPKPSKAMELGVSQQSLCQYVIIAIAASWQRSNPPQMCQQNLHFILFIFFSCWLFIAGYKLLLQIHRKDHNSSIPWCASHSCDREVFVMMNRHMREHLVCMMCVCVAVGVGAAMFAGWHYRSRRKHFLLCWQTFWRLNWAFHGW